MEKFEFKRLGVELTSEDFSLNVNTSDADASYSPIVEGFYTTALVGKTDLNAFNNVPFNKASKRIPKIDPGCTLQSFRCDWNDLDVDLSAKEITVDKLSVMVQICISDIEDSFAVWEMQPGSNNSVNPADLLSFIWNEIAKKTRRDVEYLRWYGDKAHVGTASCVDDMTRLTNGYIAVLEDEGVEVVGTTASITTANVLEELHTVIGSLNEDIQMDHDNISVFVSSDVYLAYTILAASLNHTSNALETGVNGLFLGMYKLYNVPTLAKGTIIAGHKQDFVYSYDLEEEDFVVIDRWTYAGEPTVRFRVNLKLGFDIYDVNNIVYRGTEITAQ